MPSIAWLSTAPVKGLALVDVDEIDLTPDGVADNRRFWIVDERGAMYTQLRDGRLAQVQAAFDARGGRLELRFPDGERVAGLVELGTRGDNRLLRTRRARPRRRGAVVRRALALRRAGAPVGAR